MTARFLVGDVRERMAELPDGSFDFILCSPPFLALRSYLPPDHPDKAKEIGSEATPAEFIDVLLSLTVEWGRLLAPHGSIAIELGDTYAGSGGAGGDYGDTGWRVDQQPYSGSAKIARTHDPAQGPPIRGFPTRQQGGGDGWPLDKSLACIPQLYQVALAYGINPLTGRESPAGRWRVRNLKPWIRSNPPVGALGDKERPATSYVIVATRARDRWFDLDAVRTQTVTNLPPARGNNTKGSDDNSHRFAERINDNGGAPPRDWWHHVDAILDAELTARAGQTAGWSSGDKRTGKNDHDNRGGNWSTFTPDDSHEARHSSVGAQGVHLRRALERAGILTSLEALDVSPKGYSGAHYAVWPPELVRLLVDEMCPRRVCVTCGQPSRRVTESDPDAQEFNRGRREGRKNLQLSRPPNESRGDLGAALFASVARTTVGWSDCGHGTWRPGAILDPFVGSGTTLAVATGMGRDATGIDLDERNAHLAYDRVGMFLEVDQPAREVPA